MFPYHWRDQGLRCRMTDSLGQHMSTTEKWCLPNKTCGLEIKPDKLHKCRKITSGDKRRKIAVEEFNSTRGWEGSVMKLATALQTWGTSEGVEHILLRVP